MNSNLEFLSNHVLEKNVSEILKIEKDLIHILGVEFPVMVNDKGSFVKIKGIKLDEATSSKLTCHMWSLNFLNWTLQKSNNYFGFSDLRERVVKLLVTTMGNLENSDTLDDVVSLTTYLEKEERNFIKDGVINESKATAS